MKVRIWITDFIPFIKYAVVGIIGTGVDVGVLYVLVQFGRFPLLLATSIAFIAAVVHNFLLNKIWTFREKSDNYRKLFIKFLIVSCIGLVLTNALMLFFVELLGIWYITAKLFTSGVVLTWNFLANKYWTFILKEWEIEIPPSFQYELSIVIPAYNEAKRIPHTLHEVQRYIDKEKLNAEIIVVDDGSKDQTRSVVESLKKEFRHLSVVHYRRNMGKGFAVRKGVKASRGRYILFTDADNSTPIEELKKLRKALVEGGFDIAIGSRYLKRSNVKIRQPWYRILLGRIGNVLIQLFLISDIKDTQCGFKLFTHKAAKEIFARQKVTRWGFDMEAMAIAASLHYRIKEVPVSWLNSPESRLRPIRDGIRTFYELIYIKLNLWCGRYR